MDWKMIIIIIFKYKYWTANKIHPVELGVGRYICVYYKLQASKVGSFTPTI